MNRIEISESAFQPHEIPEFLLNLAFCIVAAFLLRHLYVRKSISLSGKFHIGTVIPILATVTFLVIMVVKSSLALSLGLVGALSVIRFRTPIKEPEELVYLFLAIALGLGYGAGQTIVTSLVFVIISGMILLWLSRRSTTIETEYDLLVDWTGTSLQVSDIIEGITAHVMSLELKKHNAGENEKSAFFRTNLTDISNIDAIVSEMRTLDNKTSCTFYEAKPLQ